MYNKGMWIEYLIKAALVKNYLNKCTTVALRVPAGFDARRHPFPGNSC